MNSTCNYLCGPKYCSKQYSKKLLSHVDPVVEDLRLYVNNLIDMCSEVSCQRSVIKQSTDVASWYTPGVPIDSIGRMGEGYPGPSLYVEVSTSFSVDGSHVDKSYTYVVQLNGISYAIPDSEFYRSDESGTSKYNSAFQVVKSVYAQIGLFDFSKFDKYLESRVNEFRDTMSSHGTERLLEL